VSVIEILYHSAQIRIEYLATEMLLRRCNEGDEDALID
jgi:hypothetical protein